jgi:DNA-binding transcriptional ArsR family regulator
MENSTAISALAALAQPTRLSVLTLLASTGDDGMSAGDLAARTGTPANTMSAHLLILSQAGLASSRRAGRNIFYAARMDTVRQLVAFLEGIGSEPASER